mgnify:CR=1 FL=1
MRPDVGPAERPRNKKLSGGQAKLRQHTASSTLSTTLEKPTHVACPQPNTLACHRAQLVASHGLPWALQPRPPSSLTHIPAVGGVLLKELWVICWPVQGWVGIVGALVGIGLPTLQRLLALAPPKVVTAGRVLIDGPHLCWQGLHIQTSPREPNDVSKQAVKRLQASLSFVGWF